MPPMKETFDRSTYIPSQEYGRYELPFDETTHRIPDGRSDIYQ